MSVDCSDPEPPRHRAPVYAYLVPLLSAAARRVGYAVAVHGSMARDLDVVAVPWTDEAVSAEALLAAILASCGFTVDSIHGRSVIGPGAKPHGRKAWTIPLDGGCYIDLSVMPRRADDPAPEGYFEVGLPGSVSG